MPTRKPKPAENWTVTDTRQYQGAEDGDGWAISWTDPVDQEPSTRWEGEYRTEAAAIRATHLYSRLYRAMDAIKAHNEKWEIEDPDDE